MSLYFDAKKQLFRIRIQKGGRRIVKILPKGTTEATAREVHTRILNEVHLAHARAGEIAGWQERVSAAKADPDSWLHVALRRAQQRSRARGMPCTLTLHQLVYICQRSGGRCEVTGMPFSEERVGTKRPYFQSLDRIDSAIGYSFDNCRLVCTVVNIALGTWGAEVLHRVAAGLVLNRFYPPWLEAAGTKFLDTEFDRNADEELSA